MKNMQKEWKTYAKKTLLDRLYDENEDQKVNNFLKNYDLSKITVLKNNLYQFEMEIIFSRGDEFEKLFAEFKPWGQRFYWTIPYKFYLTGLEEILDKFDFEHYVEGKK